MAAPKKKHLIELMIEAGVKWPDGAEYAAQDKCSKLVNFYSKGEPDDFGGGREEWMANNCEYLADEGIELPSLCRKWHQTIVTRDQYEQAVLSRAAHTGQQSTQPNTEYCSSVMRQMPDNTIEQLTSDYHVKAAEADRLQTVADEALKAADDALLALEKAGEFIGLIISIDTKQKQVEQPNITDWRDLLVGDVVECVLVCGENGVEENESDNKFHGLTCNVIGFAQSGKNHIKTNLTSSGYFIQEFKFICRP